MVEKALGFQGDQTLYVGDHIYTDVSQSKVHLRWRTALICRELEKEVVKRVTAQTKSRMYVFNFFQLIAWSCLIYLK